ncbi:MAG TPA: hypothetical protein VHW23_34210 [Kofleriaceae bacterium]|jgi:hypothetical protein|nr:hypothetical protein [Kofleriaceae bacterium]
MTPEDRERLVVQRLRIIMLVVLGLAIAAVALRCIPVTIVSDHGSRLESADDAELLRIYLAVLLGPGIGAALWPRWWITAFWAVWVVPVALLALFVTFLGEAPRDHPHPDPAWPGNAIFWLLLVIHATILIVIPVVRRTHQTPPPSRPSVPVAKVHSR